MILMQFPVSSCASAYKKGCALKENAAPHSGKPIVLKMDIWDFFGNITFISVYQHAFPGELFPPSVRALLTHLCCYKDFLPPGAAADHNRTYSQWKGTGPQSIPPEPAPGNLLYRKIRSFRTSGAYPFGSYAGKISGKAEGKDPLYSPNQSPRQGVSGGFYPSQQNSYFTLIF